MKLKGKLACNPLAIWNNNTIKSDITVWCSNDYLGMSQNTHITNTMIDAVREMGLVQAEHEIFQAIVVQL